MRKIHKYNKNWIIYENYTIYHLYEKIYDYKFFIFKYRIRFVKYDSYSENNIFYVYRTRILRGPKFLYNYSDKHINSIITKLFQKLLKIFYYDKREQLSKYEIFQKYNFYIDHFTLKEKRMRKLNIINA